MDQCPELGSPTSEAQAYSRPEHETSVSHMAENKEGGREGRREGERERERGKKENKI